MPFSGDQTPGRYSGALLAPRTTSSAASEALTFSSSDNCSSRSAIFLLATNRGSGGSGPSGHLTSPFPCRSSSLRARQRGELAARPPAHAPWGPASAAWPTGPKRRLCACAGVSAAGEWGGVAYRRLLQACQHPELRILSPLLDHMDPVCDEYI